MKCEKCGIEMQNGTIVFRNGGASLNALMHYPTADFFTETKKITSYSIRSVVKGHYCGSCGKFYADFDIKKADFEKGFDMDLDDLIDRIPQSECPNCGEVCDIDYPRCPECGFSFGDDEEKE